jgi:hypothetical protein
MISGRVRAAQDEVIELGAFMPAAISADEETRCFDYASRICEAIGLDHGIFHIEMILTERGPVLVEANPRLMGGIMPSLYHRLTGTNIHEYLISIHLGEPPPDRLPVARSCVTTRKIMTRDAGRIADTMNLEWLDQFDGRLIYFDLKRARGSVVERQEIMGRLQIEESDLPMANAVADELLGRLELSLGIELVR